MNRHTASLIHNRSVFIQAELDQYTQERMMEQIPGPSKRIGQFLQETSFDLIEALFISVI